jgi:plasmid stabilization system protein ParE
VNVEFLAIAEREYQDAVNFYESQQPGLGLQFRTQFIRALNGIVAFPLACPGFGSRLRRYQLARFPYAIIYRYSAAPRQLLILAVAHSHRKPDYWIDRAST